MKRCNFGLSFNVILSLLCHLCVFVVILGSVATPESRNTLNFVSFLRKQESILFSNVITTPYQVRGEPSYSVILAMQSDSGCVRFAHLFIRPWRTRKTGKGMSFWSTYAGREAGVQYFFTLDPRFRGDDINKLHFSFPLVSFLPACAGRRLQESSSNISPFSKDVRQRMTYVKILTVISFYFVLSTLTQLALYRSGLKFFRNQISSHM